MVLACNNNARLITMNTRFNFIAGQSVFLLVLMLGFIQISAQAQQGSSQTSRLRVVDYNGDWLAFVAHLPSTCDLTIGIEINRYRPSGPLTFKLIDVMCDDIIATVAQKNPNYTWRIDGSVIEIVPANGSTSILDTPVETFKVNDVTARDAVRELLNLVEVRAAVMQAGLRLAPVIENQVTPGTKFSLDMQQVTIRQILNRIAVDSGLKFWRFEIRGQRNETFSISFK